MKCRLIDFAFGYNRKPRVTIELDSAEMAHLIDGTVQEARELGIDTDTPEEKHDTKGMNRMSNLQKILLSIKESFMRDPYCVASAKVDAAVKAMDALDPVFHEKVCASIFVSEKETDKC